MTVLSDREILAARECGDIVIEPFDRRNLGSDTYDVRLGEFYYREQRPGQGQSCLYNPWDVRDIERVWGEPCQAHEGFILLYPGETILAHTIEFIGTRRADTTKMFSRSSIGRSLMGVCKCAGRGDVGYFNRWTYEITSFSQFHTIELVVGRRLAQIEFLHVGDTERTYGVTHGKYQDGADLVELQAKWEPSMMLPRLDRDWELSK